MNEKRREAWRVLMRELGALDVLLSDPAQPLTAAERVALEASRATLRARAHLWRRLGFAPADLEVAA